MTDHEASEFVERWRRAGPELERIRREELRKLSDAEARTMFLSLLEFAGVHRQLRPTSGLIEQQRQFQKARR